MLDQVYRQSMNAQALKQLDKTVWVPDARLSMGDAEETGSMAMKQEYITKQKTVVLPEPTTIDQIQTDGKGQIFSLQDFPTTSFYYGSPYGG